MRENFIADVWRCQRGKSENTSGGGGAGVAATLDSVSVSSY